MQLYTILGIAQNATQEEIRIAYKALAMKHHPDRETGDTELFKEIQNAYEVLSDTIRRARYDKTGDTKNSISIKEKAVMELAALFNHTITNYHRDDIIEEMRRHIFTEQANVHRASYNLQELRRKLHKTKKKLLRKDGNKLNLFFTIIDNKRKEVWFGYKNTRLSLSLLGEMLILLDEYEDTADGKKEDTAKYGYYVGMANSI